MVEEKETTIDEKIRQNKSYKIEKIIVAIIGFFIYTGLIYLLIYNSTYNQGYNDGYNKAKTEFLEDEYPLEIFIPTRLPTFQVGDRLDMSFEIINTANRTIYITGFNVLVPPNGWEFEKLKPEIVCDHIQTTENVSRIINIHSESGIFGPLAKTRVSSLNPPTATKKGTYIFKYCITYADGYRVCPRESKIIVQ